MRSLEADIVATTVGPGERHAGETRVPGLAGVVSGLDLVPAHGHGIYEVEQLSREDGLRRAELLAAVFADENGAKGAVFYVEAPPRGGGLFRAVLEEGLYQEVSVLGGGFVVFEQVALAGVVFVVRRRGEDEKAAVRRRVFFQDCSLTRSAVCWAALA